MYYPSLHIRIFPVLKEVSFRERQSFSQTRAGFSAAFVRKLKVAITIQGFIRHATSNGLHQVQEISSAFADVRRIYIDVSAAEF
jgi:hypothetical protein